MGSIQPIKGYPVLKSYFCPHCHKFLMRGNIKRLAMACPKCNELIMADEELLINS